jgi:hypothetical protein
MRLRAGGSGCAGARFPQPRRQQDRRLDPRAGWGSRPGGGRLLRHRRGRVAGIAAGDFGACAGTTGGVPSFQSNQMPAPGDMLTYLVQDRATPAAWDPWDSGSEIRRGFNLDPAACQPAQVTDRRTLARERGSSARFREVTHDTHAADGMVLTADGGAEHGRQPLQQVQSSRVPLHDPTSPLASENKLLIKGVRTRTFRAGRLPLRMVDRRYDVHARRDGFAPHGGRRDASDGRAAAGARRSESPSVSSDTDRSPGAQALDWVRIDSLLVRSIGP